MTNKTKRISNAKLSLYQHLQKLSPSQFKMFYGAFVHYWVNHIFFISGQNFFNLWCELNLLCHELDESFPNQYDDYEAVKAFCRYHPYYFIDRLPLDLVASLFAEHIEDCVGILTNFAKLLSEVDMRVAYDYLNKALGLAESTDYLVSETESHIKFFR